MPVVPMPQPAVAEPPPSPTPWPRPSPPLPVVDDLPPEPLVADVELEAPPPRWMPTQPEPAPEQSEPPPHRPRPLAERSPIRIDEDDADPIAADEPLHPTAPWLAPEDNPEQHRPLPQRPAAWVPPQPGPPQYPIPPTFAADAEQPAGAVPTWAFRAPSPTPTAVASPAFVGDLSLDPMSLRRRVTIRAGASGLTVDEVGLGLRTWWRRTQVPWTDVHGFEPRFDDPSGTGGRLVALTGSGPLDLPATKRSGADLRYLHALLEAYRQRARLTVGR
jgi:hypothetical protein